MSEPPPGTPEPPTFTDRDLRGARFTRVDLSGARMRAVHVAGAEVDAPWLLDGESTFVVNDVDVAPLVDAELDRRFPGRSLRRAGDADGLREAWAAIEHAWDAFLARVDSVGPGAWTERVDGEWSVLETLRHLVMATDTWLRGAVLRVAAPYSPVGLPNAEYAQDGHDPSVFTDDPPAAEVLAVRAERRALVREHLAAATDEWLDEVRANPWAPEYPETVRSCLHTILEEEWEHLRYATRDLAVLSGRAGSRT